MSDIDVAAAVAERVGVPREVVERALRHHPVVTRVLAALVVPSLGDVGEVAEHVSPEQRAAAVRDALVELGTPRWDRFTVGGLPAGSLCWVQRMPHGGQMVCTWPAEKTTRRGIFGGPDTVLAAAPLGWTIQVVPARREGAYEIVFTAPAGQGQTAGGTGDGRGEED